MFCTLYQWVARLFKRNGRNSKISWRFLAWLARSHPSYVFCSIRWVGPQEMRGQQLCAGPVTDIYSPGCDPSLGQPVACIFLTFRTVGLPDRDFQKQYPCPYWSFIKNVVADRVNIAVPRLAHEKFCLFTRMLYLLRRSQRINTE